MNNARAKDILREFKNSLSRFLSIFTIIALGCAFFSGIKATMPDMVDSAKKYFEKQNLMDLKLMSTYGVKSEDVEAVKKADNVEGVMAAYSKEVFYYYNNENLVLKFISYNDTLDENNVNKMNKPVLIEGEYPKNKGECLVEVKVNSPKTFKIGGKIKVSEPIKGVKLSDTLAVDTYKITGIVASPMYIGYERDSTTVGNGTIISNVYVPESEFVNDYYTELFITLKGMEDYQPFSNKYKKAVKQSGKSAERAFEKSVNERYNKIYSDAEKKLDDAKEKTSTLEKALECDFYELMDYKEETQKKLDKAQKEYDNSENKSKAERNLIKSQLLQIQDAMEIINGLLAGMQTNNTEVRTEYKKQLKEAKSEINDSEKKLKKIEKPVFYKFDRFDASNDYSSFYGDSQKVDSIAKVFPVFFILVAALVCLTTMTRMVEEQRTTIGIYKALGYSSGKIASKFLIYGASAAFLGSTVGTIIGLQVFPSVIYNTYKIMYSMPDIDTPFRIGYYIGCCFVSVTLTCSAVLYSCIKELKAQPSELMRPKAPANGKRVFLEKIGFIWNRLNFLAKVTIRNLFRYKKRFFMTVIGIAGCTALIVTGLGLKYSIKSIADRQFEDIFLYDGAVVINSSKFDISELEKKLSSIKEIKEHTFVEGIDGTAENENASQSVKMMVMKDPKHLNKFLNLPDMNTSKNLAMKENSVVITQKLAKILKLKAGDSIRVKLGDDGKFVKLKISGVAKNYTMHYIYITPETYEKVYGEKPKYNLAFVNISAGVNENKFKEKLIANDEFYGITYKIESGKSFIDSLDRLDVIVYILILCAGLLAIVVLYNLSNINVTERIREIATIKVLGFYDKETSAYIYRENMISAVIGIILGWLMGIVLHKFVIITSEVDIVMFNHHLVWWAYVIAAVLTMAFTIIVNIILHIKLKKVDMVESLKSVE